LLDRVRDGRGSDHRVDPGPVDGGKRLDEVVASNQGPRRIMDDHRVAAGARRL